MLMLLLMRSMLPSLLMLSPNAAHLDAAQPDAGADAADEEDNDFDDEKDDGDVWVCMGRHWMANPHKDHKLPLSFSIKLSPVFTNVSFLFFLISFFGDVKTSFVTSTDLIVLFLLL